jgi:hypothetical protein
MGSQALDVAQQAHLGRDGTRDGLRFNPLDRNNLSASHPSPSVPNAVQAFHERCTPGEVAAGCALVEWADGVLVRDAGQDTHCSTPLSSAWSRNSTP